MRTFSFRTTDDVAAVIVAAAAAKLLTPSQFIKTLVATHINQHPPKGIMHQIFLNRSSERLSDGSGGSSQSI